MYHKAYRKELNCLNCNTVTTGKFCQECGQENLEPKETVGHLLSHFISDLTHFDGKFFGTLKVLIQKPGRLSKEYMAGRRVKYLNPIRMYFFISAVFFFVFFTVYKVEKHISGSTSESQIKNDSLKYEVYKNIPDKGGYMTREQYAEKQKNMDFAIAPGSYRDKAQYDSLLSSGKKKHNWLERQLVYRKIELEQKYRGNHKMFVSDMVSKFLHQLPQLFFLLLPLYALLLKLLYMRRRQYFFTDHIIFSIHFYILLFLVLLITLCIQSIINTYPISLLEYMKGILFLYSIFYFYKAMRNFYGQGRLKTICKYFILMFTGGVVSIFVFMLFIFLSIFEI